MKTIWIIEQVDAVPYEHYHNGIHRLFSSQQAAKKYYQKNKGSFLPKEDDYDGFSLMSPYELEVFDEDE
jgi:hypothetical protein